MKSKRLIALILSTLMVLSQMSVVSFAADEIAVEAQSQPAVEQTVDEEQPAEAADAEETAAPAEDKAAPAEEVKAAVEKKAAAAKASAKASFNKSKTVDGVKVTVKAAKGVFPKGSKLSVKKVKVPTAVDTGDAVGTYAFDISILSGGKKIQPDGKAKVSFKTDEVADKSLETAVYHMDGKTPEELKVSESGETATVTADGFSVFVVTFSQNDNPGAKTFTMVRGDQYKISDIVSTLGISDMITANGIDYQKTTFVDSSGTVTDGFALGTSDSATTVIANVKKAGTYFMRLKDGSNQLKIEIRIVITDNENDFVAPTPVENLVFDGTKKDLVTAGTAPAGMTMQYQYTEKKWSGTTEWSTTIPSDARVGEYTVNYRVISGDNNKVVFSGSVNASISYPEYTAPTPVEVTYDGETHQLVNVAEAPAGTTWYYTLKQDGYDTPVPVVTSAGTYTVNYKLVETATPANVIVRSSVISEIKAANPVADGGEPEVVSTVFKADSSAFAPFIKEETKLTDLAEKEGVKVEYCVYAANSDGSDDTQISSWNKEVEDITLNKGSYNVYYRVNSKSGNPVNKNFDFIKKTKIGVVKVAESLSFSIDASDWTYGEKPYEVKVTNISPIDVMNVNVKWSVRTSDSNEWNDYEPGTSLPVGTYAFKATVTSDNYPDTEGTSSYVEVKKANPVDATVAPKVIDSTGFTGKEIRLLDTPVALTELAQSEDVIVEYNVDNGEWSTDEPVAIAAGSHTVAYRVNSSQTKSYNGNFESPYVENLGTVTISKRTAIKTAPVAADGWTYDGEEHVLVSEKAKRTGPAKDEGVVVEYMASPKGGSDGMWTTEFPTAKDAGAYELYYRATDSSGNIEDVGETSFGEVVVSPRKPLKTEGGEPTAIEGLEYNGDEQTLINAATLRYLASKEDVKVEYKLGSDGRWDEALPKAKGADEYTIYYRANAKENDAEVLADKSNFTVDSGSVTAKIEKKTVTVNWDTESLTKTYTGKPLTPEAEIGINNGRIAGDNVVIEGYKFDQNGWKSDAVAVGTYKAFITGLAGSDGLNYQISSTAENKSRNFTIVKAEVPELEVAIDDWTYGVDPSTPRVVNLPEYIGSGAVKYEYKEKDAADTEYSNIVPSNAGEYTVRATVESTTNFDGNSGTADFEIKKADLSDGVKVSIDSWTYGDSPKKPDVTGLPDDWNGSRKYVKYEYKIRKHGEEYSKNKPIDAGEYTLKAIIPEADNYNSKEVTDDFVIHRKEVTLSWSSDSVWTYDGNPHGISAEVSNDQLVGNDELEIIYDTENGYVTEATDVNRSSEWVPSNYTVKVKGIEGERAANYKLATSSGQIVNGIKEFRIDPAEATVTPNDVSVLYGETPEPNGYEVTDLKNGETKEVILGEPIYVFMNAGRQPYTAGDNAGTDYIVAISDENLNKAGGFRAQNYNLVLAEGKLTVEKRQISFEWSKERSFTHDGNKHSVEVISVGGSDGDYEGASALIGLTYSNNEAAEVGKYKAEAILSDGAKTNYLIKGDTQFCDWEIKDSTPTPGPSPAPSVDDPVQKVVDMLKALDPNASDYAAKAQEAIDAYNKLTDDQKADKRFEEQTVATKLAGAQEAVATAADKKAADEASALINKLPADPTTANEADAQAAYAAYMALTDAQKALLSDEAKQKVAAYGYYYETQYAKAQTVKLKSVKAKKGRKAVAKWSKNADVSGYQLYYKAKGTKAKKVTISKASTVKKTVKKLKAGKKYSFKVRTYTKVYNPAEGVYERVYGQWSNVKKAKAKK